MIAGLPEKLREERKKTGLSQMAVGEIVGTTKTMMTKYETGVTTPTTEVLLKLAAFYKVSVDYLLGLERKKMLNVSALSDHEIETVRRVIEEIEKYKKT